MANKHVIHYKKTGLFVRIFGITIYFWISLLSDSFNRKEENTKNFQESSGTGQSKKNERRTFDKVSFFCNRGVGALRPFPYHQSCRA
jgi:hypothetical protein